MKKMILPILVMQLSLSAWAAVPNGYYTNAIGKSDEALMTALEGIIYTHTELGYDYMWTAYDYTDVGDDGYYIDMYSDCKYDNSSTHVAGASYVGQGINREHSFPKSWFGGDEEPMFTDLTMLIPTDAFVNQRRSNHPYGVCAGGTTYVNEELNVTMKGKLGTSTYNGYTATVFEPDDEYKGDFARIYFYMVTCYNSSIGSWPGSGQLDYNANNYKAFSDWSIQMLMEWHRADPVSAKELSRNEAVYQLQGNRNPYVDHPELAEYIWGTKQHTQWDGNGGTDDIIKELPVMLPLDEQAVTGRSFRADWTSGGDVSSYTLQVNQVEAVSLLMTENFSKVNAYSDGYTDVGEEMDNYTDNPGWKGLKVYPAAGKSLKIGTGSVIGHILSPELPLGSVISVVFNAKNWISSSGKSDNSTIVVSCGDVSQNVPLTDTPTDYTIVLRGCEANNVKLAMTVAGKRFYVYNVKVYNGDVNDRLAGPHRAPVEEGDTTWRVVSGINDTCYTVGNLSEGTYEYLVKAIYTDGTESLWSNVEHVTLTGIGDQPLIGDANADGMVTIADVTTLINYLLIGSANPFDADAADVNHDSSITINDVTALISILLTHGQ